jgi:flagellar biosynthesis anti-sigma factor FlgM
MTIDNNITNLAPGLNQAAQTSQTGQTAVSGRDGRGQDNGGDQVQLSGVASQLSAFQLSGQAWSSDPSKLARLQAAYNSGTYNVPPSQIANSIIGDALGN